MSDPVQKRRSSIVDTAYNMPGSQRIGREHTVGHAYRQAKMALAKLTHHDLKRLFPFWCKGRIQSVLRLNDQATVNGWTYLTMTPAHGPYMGSKKHAPCYICKYGIWFYCPHHGTPKGRCYAVHG